jgi:hypothetical protein
MKNIDLLNLLSPLENFLNNDVLNGKYWKLKTFFYAMLISFSILLSFNRGYVVQNMRNFYFDSVLQRPQEFFFWHSIVKQGQAPLSPNKSLHGTHESNRTFRLIIPFISRLFSLDGKSLFILQVLLGIVFLFLLLNILYELLRDKLQTFYAYISFINVYTGSCFFLNCFGHGDGYTYFFMVCCLILRSPILLCLAIQLSFWCDERSIIVVFGILFFRYFYYQLNTQQTIQLLILITLNIILYGIVRYYLSKTYHLHAADVESATINRFLTLAKGISTWWGSRIYVGLKGFSLLLLITFGILFYEKKYTYLILCLIYWIPIILLTLLVADTVRTISFTFVFWLVSLYFLRQRVNPLQLKLTLFIIGFINILIPTVFP